MQPVAILRGGVPAGAAPTPSEGRLRGGTPAPWRGSGLLGGGPRVVAAVAAIPGLAFLLLARGRLARLRLGPSPGRLDDPVAELTLGRAASVVRLALPGA
eukprot:15341513-Heterocapsa_arctica.AAC.1